MTEVTAAALEALGDFPPGRPLDQEWKTFKRELPRLFAEGHEDKWVLIKGDEVLGVWENERDAMRAGYRKFYLSGFLVQKLTLTMRPVRAGMWWRW
jgi:hypothetical protein